MFSSSDMFDLENDLPDELNSWGGNDGNKAGGPMGTGPGPGPPQMQNGALDQQHSTLIQQVSFLQRIVNCPER